MSLYFSLKKDPATKAIAGADTDHQKVPLACEILAPAAGLALERHGVQARKSLSRRSQSVSLIQFMRLYLSSTKTLDVTPVAAVGRIRHHFSLTQMSSNRVLTSSTSPRPGSGAAGRDANVAGHSLQHGE